MKRRFTHAAMPSVEAASAVLSTIQMLRYPHGIEENKGMAGNARVLRCKGIYLVPSEPMQVVLAGAAQTRRFNRMSFIDEWVRTRDAISQPVSIISIIHLN